MNNAARRIRQNSITDSLMEPPLLIPHWFFGDIPLRDHRETPSAAGIALAKQKQGKGTTWTAFSDSDSIQIENCFQETEGEGRVACREDGLYEADVSSMEIVAVYWKVRKLLLLTRKGPVHEIRRGTWFMGADFAPCDSNLTLQIENGYEKFMPWKSEPVEISAIGAGSVPKSLSSEGLGITDTPEKRW
jgi:hypothetical protein